MPIYDVLTALLLIYACAAGATYGSGLLFLTYYKRVVKGLMGRAPVQERWTDTEPTTRVHLDIISMKDLNTAARAEVSAHNEMRGDLFRSMRVYILAGVLHALAIAPAVVLAANVSLATERKGPYLAVLTMFVVNLWPVFFVLSLVLGWTRRTRGMALVLYFATLLAVGSTLSLLGGQKTETGIPPVLFGVVLWIGAMLIPTVAVMPIVDRRIRAIAPALLAFFLIMFSVPVFAASLNGPDLVALIVAGIIGVAAAGAAAYAMIALHTVRQTSDQLITLDSLWILFTGGECLYLIGRWGIPGLGGLLAFAAYRIAATIGLKFIRRRPAKCESKSLLMLRAFGGGRRIEQGFRILVTSWRYRGEVFVLSASDLASATLSLQEFFTFVRGKLADLFIKDYSALQRRLKQVEFGRDPDGRYRINQFFCTEDTWRDTVLCLMGMTEYVFMDLREFQGARRGIEFEIATLVETRPLENVILLTEDNPEQIEAVRRTLGRAMDLMSSKSPNAKAPPRARLFVIGKNEELDRKSIETMFSLGVCGATL